VKTKTKRIIISMVKKSNRFMVFNATFNNIAVISWRSVLLVDETGIPEENHRPIASHWQTSSQNVAWITPLYEGGNKIGKSYAQK